MRYCSKCGAPLNDGDKFCGECGVAVELENNSDEKNDSRAKRTQEFAGTVKKCPVCGEELPSMVAICPTCGHEINSARVTRVLQEFIVNLDNCNQQIAEEEQQDIAEKRVTRTGWSSWGIWTKIGWIILNIVLYGIPLMVYLYMRYFYHKGSRFTPIGRQKTTLIENFQIPNEKQAILDTLYFIKSKVAILCVQKKNAENWHWIKLWHTKAKQIQEKAKIVLPGNQEVDVICQEIDNDVKKAGKNFRNINIAFGVMCLVYVVAVCVWVQHSMNGLNLIGNGIGDTRRSLSEERKNNKMNEETIPDDLPRRVEIKSKEVYMGGWLQDNFEIGENGCVIKLVHDDREVKVFFDLICKKKPNQEIREIFEEHGKSMDDYKLEQASYELNNFMDYAMEDADNSEQLRIYKFEKALLEMEEGTHDTLVLTFSVENTSASRIEELMKSLQIYFEMDLYYEAKTGEINRDTNEGRAWIPWKEN